jgi:hypothetical protein
MTIRSWEALSDAAVPTAGPNCYTAVVLFVVPIPAKAARPLPPGSLPTAIPIDATTPGKFGYTDEEVTAFRQGLWREVVETSETLIPVDGTMGAYTDAIDKWAKQRWQDLADAEKQKGPLQRIAGRCWIKDAPAGQKFEDHWRGAP